MPLFSNQPLQTIFFIGVHRHCQQQHFMHELKEPASLVQVH